MPRPCRGRIVSLIGLVGLAAIVLSGLAAILAPAQYEELVQVINGPTSCLTSPSARGSR